MKHAAAPATVPLFTWPEVSEAARLDLARQALRSRIDALPACSHRRIILQHQLNMLTAQLLEIENHMRGRR